VITRPVRRIAQAAVVTSLIAGAVGVSHLDKSVTLSVDGKASTVHAFGSTVGDILEKQDIAIREHDVVVPAPGTQVSDGQKIVVRYGRKLTVTIDGRTQDYWTTATTVAAALQELGIRADSAKLSASRSMSLGRQGLALSVTTPKDVVVRVDGKNRTATTTGATVADVLTELNVTKDADDRVQPAATTAVTAGLKIAVLRVTSTQVKETKAVPAPVTRKSDSSLYEGQTKTLKAGSDGAKIVTYKVVKVDGKVESKKAIASKLTQAPVGAVVAVGTKERATADAGDTSGTGINLSNAAMWDRIAECESGGNWSINTGNGYYGGLQFALTSWRGAGGLQYAAYPHQASAAEQMLTAETLLGMQGWAAWPSCSRQVGLR
jgi:uncharacterized protein YabE (DUF348 family)